MLTKEEVISTVNAMPKEFEAEDVIEKIILLNKIHIGRKQSESGTVISIEEAKEKLKKWL